MQIKEKTRDGTVIGGLIETGPEDHVKLKGIVRMRMKKKNIILTDKLCMQ